MVHSAPSVLGLTAPLSCSWPWSLILPAPSSLPARMQLSLPSTSDRTGLPRECHGVSLLPLDLVVRAYSPVLNGAICGLSVLQVADPLTDLLLSSFLSHHGCGGHCTQEGTCGTGHIQTRSPAGCAHIFWCYGYIWWRPGLLPDCTQGSLLVEHEGIPSGAGD